MGDYQRFVCVKGGGGGKGEEEGKGSGVGLLGNNDEDRRKKAWGTIRALFV